MYRKAPKAIYHTTLLFIICKINPQNLCLLPFVGDIRFQEPNILKLPDKISLENLLLKNEYFNKVLPASFLKKLIHHLN